MQGLLSVPPTPALPGKAVLQDTYPLLWVMHRIAIRGWPLMFPEAQNPGGQTTLVIP
jgi:hypothetical protein